MMDEKPMEESAWDIKKIIIAVVLLIIFLGGAFWVKANMLGIKQSAQKTVQSFGSVEGASTENTNNSSENQDTPPPPVVFSPGHLQDDAQKKLDQIKAQVANLNVQDVASSSPQVQKVVNDIKALQGYPKDQAKQMCENLCKSL